MVPKNNIPALAANAHALVFNLIDVPVFRFGISSNKLFDYMASARPILFCSNASNNPIADAGCGIAVPPQEPDSLAKAMLMLAKKPRDERVRMGAAGRRHVEENYSYNRLAQRLAETLDACCKDKV